MNTKKMITIAVLAAIAVVLVMLVHFPIFPPVAFLEYDPADIPLLIGTLAMGVPAGIIMTVIASLVQGFTVSAASGIYGIIMHIISTSVLCSSMGITVKKTKSMLLGALVGTLAMTAVMWVANLLITPVFMGVPVDAVKGLMPFILLFNCIKAGVNSLVAIAVYKIVSKVI